MSFRKYGGTHYSSKQNVTKSNYAISDNLIVTDKIGQDNSEIIIESEVNNRENVRMCQDLQVDGNVHVDRNVDISMNLVVEDDALINKNLSVVLSYVF